MTVVITGGENTEFMDVREGFTVKNVFRGQKAATGSAGFARFNKGARVTLDYASIEEVLTPIYGKMAIESEGNTYPVKRGDFVNITLGSKVTFVAFEDSEVYFTIFPKYED